MHNKLAFIACVVICLGCQAGPEKVCKQAAKINQAVDDKACATKLAKTEKSLFKQIADCVAKAKDAQTLHACNVLNLPANKEITEESFRFHVDKMFLCRRRQSEAKSNLKSLFMAQKSWMAEYDFYASLNEIGFKPEPGNRYSYCNTPSDCRPCEQGPNSNSGFPRNMCNGITWKQVGCSTPPNHTGDEAADDMFTACATGNLDDDAKVDAWRINDDNQLVLDSDDCVD